MMEEEESRKKNDEAFLKFSKNTSSSALSLSVAAAKESTLNYNNNDFGEGQTAQTSIENVLVNNQRELVSLGNSKASEKAPGDFECTPSTDSHVSVKTTHVLTTDPGGVISIISTATSSGKVGQGSQKIGWTDISSISEKPDTAEQSLGDRSGGGGDCPAKATAGNKIKKMNINHVEIIDTTSTFKEKHVFSSDSKTTWKSSHMIEAHEASKNNNNIDKPVDASEGHLSANQKEYQTSFVNQPIWKQVPHSQSEQSKIYSLPSEHVGDPARSLAVGFDASKPGPGSILKNNSRSRTDDAPAGMRSYNQSLPTVSMVAGEPKVPVAPHSTSGRTSFTNTVQALTRSETTFYTSSLTEPVKPTMASVIASSVSTYPLSSSQTCSRNGIDIQSAADLSRPEVSSSLHQSSTSVSVYDKAAFSTRSETRNKMVVNHHKSTVPHSVCKAAEEAAEHLNNNSTKAGDTRPLTAPLPHSSELSENKLLSISSTNLPLPTRQKPSFAANHSDLAQSLQPSPVQLSAVSNQASAPHGQSCSARDNQVVSSLFSGERRVATPKVAKKSHSKSQKPKTQKVAQFTADDEFDDNDFIPVGMLQLSAFKRTDDNSTAAANVEFHSADKNVGTVYQLNQGLNVIYKQQMQLRHDQAQSVEKPAVGEGSGSVQEKLKQKVQQHKLKQLASVVQEQGLQFQGMTAQKQDEQGYDSQQNQLLLQLVQHAQQQQRQLQDQQHHLHQSQSTLAPASSGQSKSAGFLKNQGLIIHHHQAQDVKLIPGVQGLSQQNVARGQDIRAEQSEDKQCLQEHKTQQLAEVNFKNPEKIVGIDKSQKQQQRDQRYSQHHSAAACPTEPFGQLQQQTAAVHQESPWQVQSSNIPKIAERLFQQSLNEQMLPQSRPEQMLSHTKREQLAQSHNVSVSRSDPVRPLTPASAHNAMPSVNQQHPEIARMLSSPVSPRQPASPRQAVSPRRTASPIQSSAPSLQHQHLVSPNPWQSAGLPQSANSKPTSSMSPSSSYQSTSLKQAVSSPQVSDSRQSQHAAHSSTNCTQVASTGHAAQPNGQSVPVQFPASQRQFEQVKIDLIQSLTAQSEKLQYSENEQQQQGGGRTQQITADGQHVVADISVTLPNSDARQLSPLQTIPFSQTVQSFSQTVQSFSPGQIIHYRPPEHKNVQSKVQIVQKPQPSLSVQFPPPAVQFTRSPMPLTQTANSAWHPVPGQANSETTIQLPKPLSFHSSEPGNIKRSNRKLQVNQPHDRKLLVENAVESQQQQHISPTQVRDESPVSMSISSKSQTYRQDKYDEVQVKPSTTPFVQLANTHTDIQSANSYIMSSTHNRHFQTIANLTEKEANFLQSLFASTPSVQIDERIQRNQEPHPVSQMQASYSCPLEEPKRSDDSLKVHTTSATLYPEMRKNEGGLKVLSEIASKRYALDVAGKEDEVEQQVACTGAGDTAQNTPQSSHGIPQVTNQSEQASSANKIPPLNPVHVSASDIENDITIQKKTGKEQEKTNELIETKGEYSDAQSKLMDREAKDLSVILGGTPRREVRQRKPKKPFEQEDMPVKRPFKASPQKITSKKQTPVASAQNHTHKKGNSQKEKAADVKLKEEIDKEENKEVSNRQTRSTVESRLAENEKKDTVVEDGEDMESAEFDSPSRRLSRRLQEKEKELLEQKKAEENESRSSTRQPARVSYKEDESDESTSTVMTTRSSRRLSISLSDDNLLPETSERIITRSKNRSRDDKGIASSGDTDSYKESPQSSTEQKKSTNTSRTSTSNTTVSSNKENRRETRNTSKNPGNDSQSQSPARLAKTAPTTLKRMTTRQTVVELESSSSGVGVKSKRLLPPPPAEELLQWQKRVKRLDLPTVVLESFKVPDGKPGIVKEDTMKDVAKTKQIALKEVTKPETEIVRVKNKKRRQKSKKRRNRHKLPQSAAKEDLKRSEYDHSEDEEDMATGSHDENQQEKNLISDSEDVEHEISSYDQEVADAKGESSPTQTAIKNDKIISSLENDDNEEARIDTVPKEDERKDEMDNSETEKQTNRASEEVLEAVEATPVPTIIEQQSVIKCTSAFVNPTAKVEESPHSIAPSSVSAETCPLPNDRSISLTALAGERRKMLVYKLVPVLDEDASHLEDSLIPFSGFFISGGNKDRVLIPHDVMQKHVPTTTSSSAAARFGILSTSASLSSSFGLSSSLVTPALSDLSPSEVLPSNRALGHSSTPDVVCTSKSTFEWLPTVCSPMKIGQRTAIESTPAPVAWTSPSPMLSVSPVSHPSAWTPQWSSGPSQTTPPVSAGEPSPVIAAKKSRISSAVTQPSQSQYRPSQSWNTTPSSMPSSSSLSLSPLPTSSSAWDSSASVPLPAAPQQRHESSWTAPSHQSSQESPWSSTPSVTEAALESWSKDYFPSVSYTNSRAQTQLQQSDSSAQTVLPNSGYSMDAGPSQQSQMYASNHSHTASAGAPYSGGSAPQDAEFVDSRHDNLIQSYLRQVASNPGGFSQELAGFSLGQQDLAYLESRLRQSLSPNTLFSAVAAYDDASGQGTVVGHDNSLQESINLVHTVNLDMEDGHLESSNNLDLSDLRNTLTSSLTISKNLDGHRANQTSREETLNDDDEVGGARNIDNSSQQDGTGAATSGIQNKDGKKPVRERKSQYEIVTKDDVKRYHCLLCEKHFGASSIYRHLRTHDPDYKVSCSLCSKQYTQQQSLVVHWMKTHGDHAPLPDLMKSPKYEELSNSEQLQLSQGQPPDPQLKSPVGAPLKSPVGAPLKTPDGALLKTSSALTQSPGTHIKSPSDPKRRRRTSSTSDHVVAVHDKTGISKQEAAHKQVEELRRLKAEKKLASAQRKTEGHTSDDVIVAGDRLPRGTSESTGRADEDKLGHTKNMSDFADDHTKQSASGYEQIVSQKTSFPGSAATADSRPETSRMAANTDEDYANLAVMKPQTVADGQFHFNSPHTFMSTVPQFHADNIPKPISTPVVKSNHSAEPSCSKEAVSLDDESHLKPLRIDGKYECELCSTVLNNKSGYILHMRRHSNVKTKICSYCSRGFHTGQELRSHERTHTGERPFTCEICHTKFAHSGSYVSHKKSHEKRGETQPFPIIDGKVEYPPTFKKPRLSVGVTGASGETKRRVKKIKEKMPQLETTASEQPNQDRDQGHHQMSVIQRNNLDSLREHADPTQVEFTMDMPARWQNLSQQRVASEHFRPNVGSPGVGDRSINSDSLRVVTTPQSMLPPEQGIQGFVPPGDDYSSAPGNVATDYYSSAVGYSQDVVQREFLSPHADTSSSHGFYKQDKYTPRASALDTYPADGRNQAISLPANVAVEKGLQYGSSHSYSNGGQGSGTYYSPQQHSSEYPYSVPRQSEDYQQEDYDESLAQYKNDPSSSEIVKKLLQHYNVPASSFQDAVPIDYSHQIQDEPEYNRTGHGAVPEYSGMGVGRSTPAPPSYSASISSQQKLYYNSQSGSSGYESSMLRQQPLITQDPAALNLHESQQQLLQSLVMNDGQFGSSYSQGQTQDMYSSDDRYSSSHSNQSTRFASPSLQ